MLSNSIEKFPNFSRQPIPAAKPDLTNPIGELYPVDGNPPQVRRSLPFPRISADTLTIENCRAGD